MGTLAVFRSSATLYIDIETATATSAAATAKASLEIRMNAIEA